MRGTDPLEYALILGGQLRKIDPAHAAMVDNGRLRPLPGAPPALVQALASSGAPAVPSNTTATAGNNADSDRVHVHTFAANRVCRDYPPDALRFIPRGPPLPPPLKIAFVV